MRSHTRRLRGENSDKALIDAEIAERLARGELQSAIAAALGVSQAYVSKRARRVFLTAEVRTHAQQHFQERPGGGMMLDRPPLVYDRLHAAARTSGGLPFPAAATPYSCQAAPLGQWHGGGAAAAFASSDADGGGAAPAVETPFPHGAAPLDDQWHGGGEGGSAAAGGWDGRYCRRDGDGGAAASAVGGADAIVSMACEILSEARDHTLDETELSRRVGGLLVRHLRNFPDAIVVRRFETPPYVLVSLARFPPETPLPTSSSSIADGALGPPSVPARRRHAV